MIIVLNSGKYPRKKMAVLSNFLHFRHFHHFRYLLNGLYVGFYYMYVLNTVLSGGYTLLMAVRTGGIITGWVSGGEVGCWELCIASAP